MTTKAFVLGAVVATVGWAAFFWWPTHEVDLEWRLIGAHPVNFLTQLGLDCVEANHRERQTYEAALAVLRLRSSDISWLGIGAKKFLGKGTFRKPEGQRPIRVCDPEDIYSEASDLIASNGHLPDGRPVESTLRLIEKMSHVSDEVVRSVANSAFSEFPQRSEILPDLDIRPLARSTLASLGPKAAPYAEKAFGEISADNALGTSAAQIAVAGGHPDALKRVESLMRQKLGQTPPDQPIGWEDRNRLYELAYAMLLGGDAALYHIEPLEELMRRRVHSAALWFGMVDLWPKRMCSVLAQIKQSSIAELGIDYCIDDEMPFER